MDGNICAAAGHANLSLTLAGRAGGGRGLWHV